MFEVKLTNFNEAKMVKRYERKLYNAVRRGLYKAGPDIIDQYREDGLDGTKTKRLKKAKFAVRKNNTMAFIDSGIDARVRNLGATIKPKGGGFLKVIVDPKYREQERRNAAKGRTSKTFTIKKNDEILLMERAKKKKDKPKLVAVLKKEVVRKPIHPNDRLRGMVSKNMDNVQRAVQKEIDDIGDI